MARPPVHPFREDLDGGAAVEALREDIKELRYSGIGRFPALASRPAGGRAIIVGHRPDEALRAAPTRVAPDLGPLRRAASRAEYEGAWGRSTDREVDEAFDAHAADGAAALADCRDRQA